MRLVIAGSRYFDNPHTVLPLIDILASDLDPWTVLCGGAKGIDKLGGIWALMNDIDVDPYEADWTKYGKRAGPIRNAKMASNCDQVLLIRMADSQGSLSMKHEAEQRGKVVHDYVIPKSKAAQYITDIKVIERLGL